MAMSFSMPAKNSSKLKKKDYKNCIKSKNKDYLNIPYNYSRENPAISSPYCTIVAQKNNIRQNYYF